MKSWTAFVGVFLLIAAALAWCQTRRIQAPVSPAPILNLIADSERELTRLPVAFAPLPDSEEIKAGKDLEKEYLQLWRQDPNEAQYRALDSYVQKVGATVAAHARRKLPYHFHYIAGLDFVNAFALPGGPVFIGGGLISLMDSEDELACILGHEVEHIDHYHCAERIQIEAALRRLPLGALVGVPLEVFVSGYSKDQELEADREGAKLAMTAGYSPVGAIHMFQAFERLYPTGNVTASNPSAELSDLAWKTLEGYFRSHPSNPERIDQMRKLIAFNQASVSRPLKPLPIAWYFLTERAVRSLEAARQLPPPFTSRKERKQWEADRLNDHNEAIKLATRSLALNPNQPRAIETIAMAKLDLGDYAAITDAYHQLLSPYPAFADDIRKQVDSLAAQALDADQYDRAARLARQSLELQSNRPEALQILAQAQLSLSDFTGAAQTAQRLEFSYPNSTDGVRAYADQLAVAQFSKHNYVEAAACATQSLSLKPGEQVPLTILAKAHFALANFSEAASAYRKLLNRDPSDTTLARSYAEALSATQPGSKAAHEFESWISAVHTSDPALAAQSRVELAGLMLMSGEEGPAQAIVAEAQTSGSSVIAPELMGRLAWWYCRAGKYDDSVAILNRAIAQRPADSHLEAVLAWDELEQHQPQEALRHFAAAAADPDWASPLMGRAIARWQAGQTNDALKDFEPAIQTAPEWRNPRWLAALYPASVAHAVAQMDAAWQARRLKRSLSTAKAGT